MEGDPKPKVASTDKIAAGPGGGTKGSFGGSDLGSGVVLYGIILVGGAVAFGAYKYLQAKDGK